MSRYLNSFGLLFALGAIAQAAAASTTNGDRQEYDIGRLLEAANLYFADTGHYPTNDASTTWFQKIVAAGDVDPDRLRFGTTSDGTLPVDLYEHPLVYEVVNPTIADSVIIRSIGRDGIDNHGAGDDFDSRYGANLGYWNKRDWPEFYAFLCGGWLAAFMFACWTWSRSHRVFSTAVAFLVFEGALIGVVISFFFDCGISRTSASRIPDWGHDLAMYSIAGLVAGLVLRAIDFVRRHAAGRREGTGLCTNCGYDLRGHTIDSRVCPECGVIASHRRESRGQGT